MDATENGTKALVGDVLDALRDSAAVTSLLPDGETAIAVRHTTREGFDEFDAKITVDVIGGSTIARGRFNTPRHLVQIRYEWSERFHREHASTVRYELADAVTVTLETLPGRDRLPNGGQAGISPQYDAQSGRYVADKTYRFATVTDLTDTTED